MQYSLLCTTGQIRYRFAIVILDSSGITGINGKVKSVSAMSCCACILMIGNDFAYLHRVTEYFISWQKLNANDLHTQETVNSIILASLRCRQQ